MQSTCHTVRMSPSVMRGGSTRTAARLSAGTTRLLKKSGFGASKRSTSALRAGSGTAGWVLRAGMFISGSLRRSRNAAVSYSHLDALDRQALEIGGRILRIEHFAV